MNVTKLGVGVEARRLNERAKRMRPNEEDPKKSDQDSVRSKGNGRLDQRSGQAKCDFAIWTLMDPR